MNNTRFINGLLATFLMLGLFVVTSCEEDEPTPSITCEDFAVTLTMDPDSSLALILIADVEGGTAPYAYEWSTGETTSSIEIAGNLNENYTITVTDAGGCTEVESFGPDPCDFFTASINVDSNGTAAIILLANPSSGTAPYTYVWSNGATTNSIEVSDNGTYTVDITDANGCTTSASYEYTYIEPCLSFMVQVGVAQDSTGTGSTDILYASVSGGLAPYAYAWSTGETTYSIVPSGTGNYAVTVTDSYGCVAEDDIDY